MKDIVNEIKQDFKMHDEKHKQIEEMAKDYYGYSIDLEDDCKFVAEEMYNKGHRKIPENSVVLSRDNYNRLKRDSELFEELVKKKVHLETVIELSNAQYEKVLEENKSLLRLISLIDDLPEKSLLDLDKWIESIKAKERKETAEKILDLLVPDCKACDENWHSGCLCLRATLAEKIAKQFGLEIKE